MRVAIITGGRDQSPTEADRVALLATLKLHDVIHVIHGADPAVMASHEDLKRKAWVFVLCAVDDTIIDAHNKEMANMAHALTDARAWGPARRPLWVLLPGALGNAEGFATHDGFELVRVGDA